MIFATLLYLVVSLIIGLVITIITWQRSGQYVKWTDVTAFFGCTVCFALVWPLMAIALLTEK